MCGLAGAIAPSGSFVDPARLADASRLLIHRGPDDHGFLGWREDAPVRQGASAEVVTGSRIALAHRRLSILDLTEAARQPMSTPDGTVHLVFNGEIYNYRELRAELEALGHRFVSNGDTEVLLHAYLAWGQACLPRLVGMFALAFVDLRARRLFLARDPFGIKPLYYVALPHQFSFASEIRSLLALSGLAPSVNPARLYHYLRFGLTDHGGETLLRGVRQLPASHAMEVDLNAPGTASPYPYWRLSPTSTSLSFEEAASRLRELFLESVAFHLRSDVPVGAALSGGIDSSSIVLSMRHLVGPSLELHTVSYVAAEPGISEAHWIDLAGEASAARMHRVEPAPEELVQDLERLIDVQGEPFGSTSIYAQHRVFREAREQGLKVMLDGQGADELLAGYRTYLPARALSLLRRGHWVEAARFLRAIRSLPGSPARDAVVSLGFQVLPPALHRMARRVAGRPLDPPWLKASWFDPSTVGASPFTRAAGRDALREMLLSTLTETSLPMLLRHEDRNSMAFSIESRVPFLTPALASFVLSLPEEYLLTSDGTSKAVFREAMRGLVPDAILDRRDKIGFATPERAWLTRLRPWVESILGGEAARAIPALKTEAMREEWQGILDGRRRFDWHVWRWINLVRWSERLGVAFER